MDLLHCSEVLLAIFVFICFNEHMRNQTAEQLKQDIVFTERVYSREFIFHTTWGLFSPKKIDEGTRILLHSVNIQEDDDILDIGSGYGALGIPLASLAPRGTTYLVDANIMAVEYAKKNAEANGLKNVQALASYGLSHIAPKVTFDQIVANLPANVGREMLYILLSDAADHLKEGGVITVVVIAGLRQFIKFNLDKVLGNHKKVRQEHGYAVFRAVKEKPLK